MHNKFDLDKSIREQNKEETKEVIFYVLLLVIGIAGLVLLLQPIHAQTTSIVGTGFNDRIVEQPTIGGYIRFFDNTIRERNNSITFANYLYYNNWIETGELISGTVIVDTALTDFLTDTHTTLIAIGGGLIDTE